MSFFVNSAVKRAMCPFCSLLRLSFHFVQSLTSGSYEIRSVLIDSNLIHWHAWAGELIKRAASGSFPGQELAPILAPEERCACLQSHIKVDFYARETMINQKSPSTVLPSCGGVEGIALLRLRGRKRERQTQKTFAQRRHTHTHANQHT